MRLLTLVVLTFVLSIGTLGFCQENLQDVIYLKNGSIIRGLIIEQAPGKYLKIQTQDGNVFVYNFDEIEKMTKELPNHQRGQYYKRKDSGYRNIPLLGIMSGEGETIFSFSNINGSMIGYDLFIGFGVGYDIYPNGSALPLFLDFRGYFSRGNIRPLFFADIGYALGWIKEVSGSDYGGLMLNLGFGINIGINEKTSFLAQLGYKYQESKVYTEYWGYGYYSETSDIEYNFFTLMVGFAF